MQGSSFRPAESRVRRTRPTLSNSRNYLAMGNALEPVAALGLRLVRARLDLHVGADDALPLLVREQPVRSFRGGEDAIDELVGRRQPSALEPEDDVRAARHRT